MSKTDRVGNYHLKHFSKERRNITLVVREGWLKHTINSNIEVDVTDAKKMIKKIKDETGYKVSFTAWIIKCVSESISIHKELNSYRQGRRKIVIFDDVDVGIPVEREINDEKVPMGHVIRKTNEKTVKQITDEIRSVQKEKIKNSNQVLGGNLTSFERFILNTPLFFKRLFLDITRRNGILKKKHMGTVGVTAIGMKGNFPGWAIPLGGITSVTVVVSSISKKPRVLDDKIVPRDILNLTISVDHDIVDGGPLARFIETLSDKIKNCYGLEDFL